MVATVRSHPLYAELYDWYNKGSERNWLGECRQLVLDHARGAVLEIGSGTGMNLLYYKNIDRVIVSEPDPAMRRKLKQRLPKAKIPAEIIDAAAERLPFPDASFDTVVSTLVLCSVDDPQKAAAELRRVVRPGGVLLVLEHIKTDEGGLREVVQDAIVPLWRLLVGGCRCNRPSLDTLAAAGFEISELRRFAPGGVPYVTHPFVVATGRPC